MNPTQQADTPLAIDGGEKAFANMVGVAQPKIGVEEFLSIAERFGFDDDALRRLRQTVSNDDLPQGGPHLGRYHGSASPSMGDRFEALAREAFKVRHAYAVCNGTSALQAAFKAAGVGPGTEFICPATGFIATSLAGALLGATPVFCDVDASMQMDPTKLEAVITDRTVAVVPTHHWGFVCDMEPIMAIARQRGLKVVEDCAQSPGATYRGQPVGSIGDLGCFSIASYKIIGGGEGGMVITHDDRLYDRVRQAAEAGGLWRSDRFAKPQYEGELFIGSNFRMSELESAVNVVQMQKLDGVVGRSRRVWSRIRKQLGDYEEIEWQKSNDADGDIGYLMRFFPRDEQLGGRIADALRAEGVPARTRGSSARPDWHVYHHYFPLFESHADRCGPEHCPVAVDLYDRCVSLPLNQWWADADCDAAAFAINKVLSTYCTRRSEART